jgi:hypothetical protein
MDALDECFVDSSEKARMTVLSKLQELGPNVKLMVTGRPHITSTFILKFEDAVQLDIKARDADIEKYIEAQIGLNEKLMKHTRQDQELRHVIRNTLINKAKGM